MQRDHFRLGLTVITMVVLGVALTIFIGKGSFARRDTLVVLFPADSPLPLLKKGSPVRYGGQDVGKVTAVRLIETTDEQDRGVAMTRIEAQVGGHVGARVDAEVVAVGPLLGGAGMLEIRRRGVAETVADEDHPIDGTAGGILAQFETFADELDGETTGSMMALIKSHLDDQRDGSIVARVQLLVTDLATAAENLKKQTDPDQREAIVGRLNETLDHLATIAASVREQTELSNDATVMTRVLAGLDELNATLVQARELLTENRPEVLATVRQIRDLSDTFSDRIVEPIATELNASNTAGLLSKVHASVSSLHAALEDVEEAAERARGVIVMNEAQVGRIVTNVKETSDHLKAAGKDLRRNPWRLLYEPSLEETEQLNILDAAREFADAASQLDDAVARLEGLSERHRSGVSTKDPLFVQIKQEIKRTLERFSVAEEALWQQLEGP